MTTASGAEEPDDLEFDQTGFDPFSSAFGEAVDLAPDDENPFDAAGDFAADFSATPTTAKAQKMPDEAEATPTHRDRGRGVPRQDTLSGNNPFRVASTEAEDPFLAAVASSQLVAEAAAEVAAAATAAAETEDETAELEANGFDPLSTIYPESDNSGDENGAAAPVSVKIGGPGKEKAAAAITVPHIQGPPSRAEAKAAAAAAAAAFTQSVNEDDDDDRFNPFNICGASAAPTAASAVEDDIWGEPPGGGAPGSSRGGTFEVDWARPAVGDADESGRRSRLRSETPPMPPFEPFHPACIGDSWKLFIRMPETKKKLGKQMSKFTSDRFWKDILVRLVWEQERPTLKLFNLEDLENPYRCIRLEPFFQLSHAKLQQYDKYGKLHIFKVNLITYKEMVGVRTEKWSLKTIQNMLAKPKTTDVLDHMPVRQEIVKFGSINQHDIRSLMWQIEDLMMRTAVARDRNKAPVDYIKEEVCAHVQDEYEGSVNLQGHILRQKSRTRVFFTAFAAGMPYVELGLNDKWRYGNEVVKRQDIIPMLHDDWIDMYEPQFHSVVDMQRYERSHMICFYPLDACRFELMRFRVALRDNQELPVQLKCVFSIDQDRVNIRCDVMVPGFFSSTTRCHEVPAEDIEIRIPIPEDWVYFFRQEGKFKYNSVHSALRKPGRIKGIERITQMAQGFFPPSIMEANVGVAKYEHLYRAIVWRIARLPEKHHGAYKSHLFTCRLQLGPHDTVPSWEALEPNAHVEFRMPGSTVSGCTVRSISLDHTAQAGKFVQYTARYSYSWAICYEFGERKKPPVTSVLDEPSKQKPKQQSQPPPPPPPPPPKPVFTDLEIPDDPFASAPSTGGEAPASTSRISSAFDPLAAAFGFGSASAASPPPRPPPPPSQQQQQQPPMSIFQSALPGALSELLGLQVGGTAPAAAVEAANPESEAPLESLQ